MENNVVIVLAMLEQVKVDVGDGRRLTGGREPVKIVSKRKKKSGKKSSEREQKLPLFYLSSSNWGGIITTPK